jgi:hypothetical protein
MTAIHRSVLLCLVAAVALATGSPALAQDEDRVPTAARRAAEWHPSPEGSNSDAWFFSGAVGVGWFSGDRAVNGQPGFTAELRAAREISSNFYVVGSYLLAIPRTEVSDPLTGTTETGNHALHVPTIGLGYRAEVTPEVHLYIEPRIGGVFGGDVDAAPAGGASAGVQIDIRPGMAVDVRFTGLLTDTKIDTRAGDVDLSGIWSIGLGLTFEF